MELINSSGIWILTASLIILLIVYLIWGNKSIKITNYDINSEQLPQQFSGIRIAQISDLHNAQFGKNNCRLIKKLNRIKPDLIVITGDLIDSRRTNFPIALSFARQAVTIAPTYYIPGNHEVRISDINSFYQKLVSAGITLLHDESTLIYRSDAFIRLAGLIDANARTVDPKQETKDAIDHAVPKDSVYTVLLSHCPKYFEIYAASGADLVLTGHVHGGQIRLPFIGGLYAPGQGLFPKYDAGLFTKGHTYMIISRGLGNSLFPLRFYNRPEIVITRLQTKK